MLSVASPPCDEGAIRGAPNTPGCASHAKRWVLLASVLGSSVASVEASVLNVALPAIQRDLDASVEQMQWIASVYTLVLAALVLGAGSLGDRFGRRRLFALGLVILAVSSAAAGLVGGARQLIVARAVQGLGAAFLVPNSLALLSAAFPKAERGRAIGTWSGATAIANAAGPLLGGLLVDTLSWRAALVLVVPLALVALGVALLRVPEVGFIRRPGRIDWGGVALATAGLTTLVLGLTRLAHGPRALVPTAVGLLLLVGFCWREWRAPEAMVPPRLFRSRTFVGVNLLTLLLYFALAGAFFLLPFDLVGVQGYSATATGAAYLPFALLLSLLSRLTGGLADRFGPRRPIVVGTLVAAAGFALLALPGVGGSYWTTFFPAMAAIGLGMAITVPPLTTAVMAAVDEADVGVASGVNNTIARVAGLLAVAMVGLAALVLFERDLAARLPALDLTPTVRAAAAAERPGLGVVAVPAAATPAERDAIDGAADAAFVAAFRRLSLLLALLAAAGAFAAAVMIEGAPVRAAAAGDTALVPCGHVDLVVDVVPRTAGCEECLRLGQRWVQLRLCLMCGHVGCCDSSRHRHATAHFWSTSHPIVRSLEPGEGWRWCYVDESAV